MKNKMIGNEIKWYKPFALVKRNKDLELLTQNQFDIINEYKEDLDLAKKRAENLEKLLTQKNKEIDEMTTELNVKEQIIKSLEEDKKSILAEIEVKPKRTRKKAETTKTTKTAKTKKETTTTKKAATKRIKKVKEEK